MWEKRQHHHCRTRTKPPPPSSGWQAFAQIHCTDPISTPDWGQAGLSFRLAGPTSALWPDQTQEVLRAEAKAVLRLDQPTAWRDRELRAGPDSIPSGRRRGAARPNVRPASPSPTQGGPQEEKKRLSETAVLQKERVEFI